jgi:hypothetical protein
MIVTIRLHYSTGVPGDTEVSFKRVSNWATFMPISAVRVRLRSRPVLQLVF